MVFPVSARVRHERYDSWAHGGVLSCPTILKQYRLMCGRVGERVAQIWMAKNHECQQPYSHTPWQRENVYHFGPTSLEGMVIKYQVDRIKSLGGVSLNIRGSDQNLTMKIKMADFVLDLEHGLFLSMMMSSISWPILMNDCRWNTSKSKGNFHAF